MGTNETGAGAGAWGLQVVSQLCSDAYSQVEKAAADGEKLELAEALHRAILKRTLSEKELTRVWALFALGAQVARRIHRARFDRPPQAFLTEQDGDMPSG